MISGLNAIRNTGDETNMRRELAEAVGSIIEHISKAEHLVEARKAANIDLAGLRRARL